MKLISQILLPSVSDYTFFLNGVFYPQSCGSIWYAYRDVYTINFLCFSPHGGIMAKREFESKHEEAPSHWKFVQDEKGLSLFCSNEIGFFIPNGENDIQLLNRSDVKYYHNVYHLEDDSFTFKNIRIDHLSSFKYRCMDTETGKEKWRIKLKGYLYHDIVLVDDSLYFGTAEYGGALYCVDCSTGEIRYSYNNGGCSKFIFNGEYIYLYKCGKCGQLVQLDRKTGECLGNVSLEGQVNIDCPLFYYDGMIITVSYQLKGNNLMVPCISCFRI